MAVLGPTAVGKTAVSIELAKITGSEIVSCDSRQFFRHIPIGTAHPSQQELAQVPHHFINFLELHQDYSAGKYELDALATIEKLHQKSKSAVLVGGSGLYVNAVLQGFDEMPEKNEDLRATLNEQFELQGIEYLQQQLQVLDPQYFEKVDICNPHRIIRGLEVVISTGKSILSFQHQKSAPRPFEIIKIGLETNREVLYQRIDARVDAMLAQGLLQEVKALHHLRHLNALQTVGYTEFFDYFEGKHDFDEAVRLVKRNSRRYAKRQMTWLRKQENIHWFAPTQVSEMINFVQEQIQIKESQ